MNVEDKAKVLGQIWLRFRSSEAWEEFFEFNDVGLPLAYHFSKGLVDGLSPSGAQVINETFKLFIEPLNLSEDEIKSLPEINFREIFELAKRKKSQNLLNHNEIGKEMAEEYDHDQAVKDMISREQKETAVPYFKCPECGYKFFGKVPPEICPKCE
jgi:predicted Zn-ribbon and HTH transcriptional regulator